MKTISNLVLILALGAPAAAELPAPQLPLIDAASVRAGLTDKENINIGAAFPGLQACKFTGVQGDTCSFACKDGSTVQRPRLNSSIAQNGGCPTMVMVPAAAPKAARAGGGISGTYEFRNSYGEGSVTVWQFPEGGAEKAEFQLFTVAGPNAHIAEIGGVAVRGADGAFVFAGEDGCRLSLRASGRGLRISGADATCGAYMGLGAIADGEYLKKN